MFQNTFDTIIVGARVAGAPTAMLLARKGYRVLLVDRATFPSDTIATHNLTLAAMASLERWGLYGSVAAGDCPPVDRVLFDIEGLVLEGWPGPHEGVELLYNVRRSTLDDILVKRPLKPVRMCARGSRLKRSLSRTAFAEGSWGGRRTANGWRPGRRS